MDTPERFATSDTPMLTNADLARILHRSRTIISRLVAAGTLTPQRFTLRGRPLYEPEYVEWALENVPELEKRMSEQPVE